MQEDIDEVRKRAGPFLMSSEIQYNKMSCRKGKSKEQKYDKFHQERKP